MDLTELESKAKADATRILDGTQAEVGKGVKWYEDHRVLAVALALVIAVIVVSYVITHL